MTSVEEATGWARGLDDVAARIAPRFGRAEPRRRARAYLRGLIAPLGRKNGWQLAEAAGDRTPDAVQDFLARMRWDADLVRDDLRGYVVDTLGDPQAVLVLDETGFIKKGRHSVGVQRQYSGTAGRIKNCQIGVFLGYASRHGQALMDRALYLPKSWTADAARLRKAGVPPEIAFATKPVLARQMLARAFEAGVPCAFVAGDSVYGADSRLRRFIEAKGKGYVLEVTSAQRLGLRRVDDWARDIPAEDWTRLSAGEGAKGPRLYDWAYRRIRGAAKGWQKGLLIRRKLDKPEELAFYLTLAPAPMRLRDLVRVAGQRWTIEACFEAAKGEVGLDQYEVRSWTGWHRHITLAMLAHAYLAAIRAAAGGEKRSRGSAPGASTPDGSGGASPALASGVGAATRLRAGAGVVAVAATTPAARPPMPLEAENQSP